MALEPEPRADDIHLSRQAPDPVVDPASLEELRGTRIDYEEELFGRRLQA